MPVASAMVLGSTSRPRKRSSGDAPSVGTCKCSYNPRTRRNVEVCFVGKSKQFRSGWKFTKGGGGCRR